MDQFSICIRAADAQTQAAGDSSHYLYVRGEKGALTQDANLTVTDNGTTYRVFTTPDLQALGVGYIARWRVITTFGAEHGQWRTPQAGWPQDNPDPAITGIPFWPNRGDYRFTNGTIIEPFSPFSSFADWLEYASTKSAASNFMYVVRYGVQFESRYVMLVDAHTVWNAELDPFSSGDVQVELASIRPHPLSYGVTRVYFTQTFRVNLQPWGTCKTPAADEATIHLNTLFATELAQPGSASAYKPFTLTLTQCPRVPIR